VIHAKVPKTVSGRLRRISQFPKGSDTHKQTYTDRGRGDTVTVAVEEEAGGGTEEETHF
jgi:hypothetical protein